MVDSVLKKNRIGSTDSIFSHLAPRQNLINSGSYVIFFMMKRSFLCFAVASIVLCEFVEPTCSLDAVPVEECQEQVHESGIMVLVERLVAYQCLVGLVLRPLLDIKISINRGQIPDDQTVQALRANVARVQPQLSRYPAEIVTRLLPPQGGPNAFLERASSDMVASILAADRLSAEVKKLIREALDLLLSELAKALPEEEVMLFRMLLASVQG